MDTLQDILEDRDKKIYNKFIQTDSVTVNVLATEYKLTPYYIRVILKKQRALENIKFNGRLRSKNKK